MEPIIYSHASACGRRHERNGLDNQDRLFCHRLGSSYFFGCWDGISAFGERGGDAAQIALDTTRGILSQMESPPDDARRFLIDLVNVIQEKVLANQRPIGTTMTACLIEPSEGLLHSVHIGNSLILITQNGSNLHKITKDDTDRLNAGALLRWVGAPMAFEENSLYSCTKLSDEEVVVLCTDGVAHAYSGREQDIEAAIKQCANSHDLEEITNSLVANAHNHTLDDVSLICIKLNGGIIKDEAPALEQRTSSSQASSLPKMSSSSASEDELEIKHTGKSKTSRVTIVYLIIMALGILIGYLIALYVEKRPPGSPFSIKQDSLLFREDSIRGDSLSINHYIIPNDSL